jgi:predicted Rdx family selenoprotein
VIINHHIQETVLDNANYTQWEQNVFEVNVNKESNGLTLGDLRNMSLELVGHDSYWMVWDDDDYRDPKLLSQMMKKAIDNNAICVAMTNRFEYNVNTNFVWKSAKKNGFPHVLAKFDRRVRYMSKNTMEDVNIIADYAKIGKTVMFDNTHNLYIRIVHSTNTSLYVDYNKADIVNYDRQKSPYIEAKANSEEQNKVRKIISNYLL